MKRAKPTQRKEIDWTKPLVALISRTNVAAYRGELQTVGDDPYKYLVVLGKNGVPLLVDKYGCHTDKSGRYTPLVEQAPEPKPDQVPTHLTPALTPAPQSVDLSPVMQRLDMIETLLLDLGARLELLPTLAQIGQQLAPKKKAEVARVIVPEVVEAEQPQPQPQPVVVVRRPKSLTLDELRTIERDVDDGDMRSLLSNIDGKVLKEKVAKLYRYSGVKDVSIGTQHVSRVKHAKPGTMKYHHDTSDFCFQARAYDDLAVVDLYVYPAEGRKDDVVKFMESL